MIAEAAGGGGSNKGRITRVCNRSRRSKGCSGSSCKAAAAAAKEAETVAAKRSDTTNIGGDSTIIKGGSSKAVSTVRQKQKACSNS